MSELTRKQQACTHPIEKITRATWARGWALFCAHCNLRFSMYPDLVASRREVKGLQARLAEREAYWRDQRQQEIAARVQCADDLKKEKVLNAECTAELVQLRKSLAELNLILQGERELARRQRGFLRALLLAAVDAGGGVP